MSTPRDLAAEALRSSSELPRVGTWSYALGTDTWTWSPEVFAMLGFRAGEVVPTSRLLLAHRIDGDALPSADVLAEGVPFASTLRLRDARRRERLLLLVGRPADSPHGVPSDGRVRGFVVDLTESLRLHSEGAVGEALANSQRHRSAIEQAKGALMAWYGLSEDEAFGVLTRHSQHLNVKVRDLAIRLVERLPGRPAATGVPSIDELLESLSADRRPNLGPGSGPCPDPATTPPSR